MDTINTAIEALVRIFAPADFAAVAITIATMIAMTVFIEHPPWPRLSVTRLMNHHRRSWMTQMGRREVRIVDGQLLGSLRQGSAFFASTCLIAIGGAAALIGQGCRRKEAPVNDGAPR